MQCYTREQVASSIQLELTLKFGVLPENIRRDLSVRDDLGADSLEICALINALEEGFRIQISTADVHRLRTFADYVRYVCTSLRKLQRLAVS